MLARAETAVSAGILSAQQVEESTHASHSLLLAEQIHRQSWLRSEALARRRQAPLQHGRGRIQARRPRPHLPQIHLRRLRGDHATLLAGKDDYAGAGPEDPDEYKALNIFWVPPGARWTYLQNSAKQPEIGKIVDDAMVAIERDWEMANFELRMANGRWTVRHLKFGTRTSYE
jgi:hypothetical protein